MPGFFRDGHSSDSDSSDDSDSHGGTASSPAALPVDKGSRLNGGGRQSDAPSARSSNALIPMLNSLAIPHDISQRDILLHALLEERCLRQAQDEVQGGQDSSEVRQVADRQYQHLSKRLGQLGLTSAVADSHAFSSARQQFRDGLDVLRREAPDSRLAKQGQSAKSIEHSLLELQRLNTDLIELRRFTQVSEMPNPLAGSNALSLYSPRNHFSLTTPSSRLLMDTRYRRDFEEVSLLGRGGYGIVHHCKHRWDGLSYAIKRIPLSTTRLRGVQHRGQAEIDEMLLELTTLARLDHPNIVRYFGGWVELSSFEEVNSPAHVQGASMASYTPTPQHDSHRVAEVAEHDYISFDTSVSGHSSTAAGADDTASSDQNSSHLHRVSTHATVSDGETETLSRATSDNIDVSTVSTYLQNAPPCLALHIQMGLYPSSLADILTCDALQQPRHCFHIEPAARLLSALIDGVEYLHHQGVVHRDLKPANIFLTHRIDPGAISCRQCHSQNIDCPAFRVRIGDFGLVTAIAQQQDLASHSPVGTQLYQPVAAHGKIGLRALDWFAIGLIAFELIWPFSTRMERYETMAALKVGTYPTDFATRFGQASVQIKELIESLLRPSDHMNVNGLRAMLRSIYTN